MLVLIKMSNSSEGQGKEDVEGDTRFAREVYNTKIVHFVYPLILLKLQLY
jgi:hypothetical protein